jgi:hypothetical protein
MRKLLVSVLVIAAIVGGGFFSLWVQRNEDTTGPRGYEPFPSTTDDSTVAAPFAGQIQSLPGGRVYWGAFRQGAPYDRAVVEDLQSQTGEWPAILMWYQEWAGEAIFDVESADWLMDRGIVPMVTWEPWQPPQDFGDLVIEQPNYRLRRIADGFFDGYIAEYANAIKTFGGPVMVRPFHEMDGFWYPWGGLVNGNSPEDLLDAWRHVHDIFEEVGATNVTWVWSVNHLSVPDIPENSIDRYWPGDAYVDWIGISGFNWGAAGVDSTWKPFREVYDERYQDLRGYDKPIVLTELGTPEVGGDKAAWIQDAFDVVQEDYPRIKAVLWYDKRDTGLRDWRISSSPEALQSFNASIRDEDIYSAPQALATAF